MEDNRDPKTPPSPRMMHTKPVVAVEEVKEDLPRVKTERMTELQPMFLALFNNIPETSSTLVPTDNIVDSDHVGVQTHSDANMEDIPNLAPASILRDTAVELNRVGEEERGGGGTVALLGAVKEEQLSTPRAGAMSGFPIVRSGKALSLGPEPEPVQIGNGWLHEFEIAEVDIVEGKPWLMARTCAEQIKEEFGEQPSGMGELGNAWDYVISATWSDWMGSSDRCQKITKSHHL